MLKPRIVVSLLLRENGLYKTISFKDPKYVGDPLNAVRIFNELEVDELAIFDIGATSQSYEPNYELLRKMASQSRMPLCYCGGVKSVSQARKIFQLGIEKIGLSSAAIEDPTLLKDLISEIGSQSIVVVLDIKKNFFGRYEVRTHNGTKSHSLKLIELVNKFEALGIGELIINSIDRDGTREGYDLELFNKVVNNLSIPCTIVGGAGNYDDIAKVIAQHEIIGVAAGSLFTFRSGPFRAVLLSYPDSRLKQEIMRRALDTNEPSQGHG